MGVGSATKPVGYLFLAILFFSSRILCEFKPCDESSESVAYSMYPNLQRQLSLFTPKTQLSSNQCTVLLSEVDSEKVYGFVLRLPEQVIESCEVYFEVSEKQDGSKTMSVPPQPKFNRGCVAIFESEQPADRNYRIYSMLRFQAYNIIVSRMPWKTWMKVYPVLISHYSGEQQELKATLFKIFIDEFRLELGETLVIYKDILREFIRDKDGAIFGLLKTSFSTNLETVKLICSKMLTDHAINAIKIITLNLYSVTLEQANLAETLIYYVVPDYKARISSVFFRAITFAKKFIHEKDLKDMVVSTSKTVFNYLRSKTIWLAEKLYIDRFQWQPCSEFQRNFAETRTEILRRAAAISEDFGVLSKCLIQFREQGVTAVKVAFEKKGSSCEIRFVVEPSEFRVAVDELASLSFCHRQHSKLVV